MTDKWICAVKYHIKALRKIIEEIREYLRIKYEELLKEENSLANKILSAGEEQKKHRRLVPREKDSVLER